MGLGRRFADWLRATESVEHAQEASDSTLIATGAVGAFGAYGYDAIDGDYGYTSLNPGERIRALPPWTLEKARAFSVAAYRSNPMARAILDTYTSFCVGDSGVSLNVTNPQVRHIAEQFWNDPANHFTEQDIMLRSHLIYGESVYEMMVGEVTGVCRRSPIDPTRVDSVLLYRGNPLWPGELVIGYNPGDQRRLEVIRMDDVTELRTGEAVYWRSFRTLETDLRGTPFLMPVLDWLDNYDTVLSNLIDRTALARHIAFDVTISGSDVDETKINEYIKARGGRQIPKSGTIEVHNDKVKWTSLNAQSGSFEDTNTAGTILTSTAAGAGLAKTWLAEPEHANRATSLTMAEPVRRRVGGVQNLWLGYLTEMVRFAVDRAVASGMLPAMVEVPDERQGTMRVPAAQTVTVTGPEVAQADASIVAQVIVNLGTGIQKLVQSNALSPAAAQKLTERAWEQFMGMPYDPQLDQGEATDPETITDVADSNMQTVRQSPLAPVLNA